MIFGKVLKPNAKEGFLNSLLHQACFKFTIHFKVMNSIAPVQKPKTGLVDKGQALLDAWENSATLDHKLTVQAKTRCPEGP